MGQVGTEPTDTFSQNRQERDGADDRGDGPQLGEAGAILYAQARSGAPLYWRLPGSSSCQTWVLDGAMEGVLRRTGPAPVLEFPYAFDEEEKSLVIGSDELAYGALGEYGVSSLCSESLALQSHTVDSVALGHGRWYLSVESCEASGAQSPPDSCVSRMGWALQSKANEPNLLASADGGAIFTIGRDNKGQLACMGWRYDGAKLEALVTPGERSSTRVSYSVGTEAGGMRVSGPSYQDASGSIASSDPGRSLPVVQVDRHLYFVDGFPWTLNAERCQSLSRLRSK